MSNTKQEPAKSEDVKVDFYFLSPVQVVKVEADNLEAVARWCGGEVQETESRRVKGRKDPYVWVPTPEGSKISWAFPGMYITKRLVITIKGELRETFAVFRRDYFDKNYFGTQKLAVDKTWERQEKETRKRRAKVDVASKMQDAMHDAVLKAQKAVQEAAAKAGISLDDVDLSALDDVRDEIDAQALNGTGTKIVTPGTQVTANPKRIKGHNHSSIQTEDLGGLSKEPTTETIKDEIHGTTARDLMEMEQNGVELSPDEKAKVADYVAEQEYRQSQIDAEAAEEAERAGKNVRVMEDVPVSEEAGV